MPRSRSLKELITAQNVEQSQAGGGLVGSGTVDLGPLQHVGSRIVGTVESAIGGTVAGGAVGGISSAAAGGSFGQGVQAGARSGLGGGTLLDAWEAGQQTPRARQAQGPPSVQVPATRASQNAAKALSETRKKKVTTQNTARAATAKGVSSAIAALLA